MDLLPVALHQGGIVAAEVLVEDIERNQNLSVEDQVYLQQFKAQLSEKKNCPNR